MRRHAPLALALLCLCAPLTAQEARLTGLVTDSSGAVLPDVAVTATQQERNVAVSTTSNTEGRYQFPRLPIGTYQVRAERTGFKAFVQSDLSFTTNADILLNITLELGSVTEQVTVSAEASRVSTETATIQQLVDGARIVDLPLDGRNVYQLARLVPGVGESGVNIGGGRSGGQNSAMVNVRVDGNLNVDNVFQSALPLPSPDAVQEFTIQTSVPPAKYGYASGVIEVSTKSGTNELHGSLYEFLRNDALDARNFFLPTKNKRKRNQYGFAGGGPVRIPKLFDGRNRTFWFLNLEQQKEPLTAASTIFVPTARQLQGDFSEVNRVLRDPGTRQPYPNNQIPLSQLDPLALNFSRQYVPEAQDALGTHRYQRPNDNNPKQLLFRGDQLFGGGKHQVSGRVFVTRFTGPAGHGNLPSFQQGKAFRETDLYGLTYTSSLSPNKINIARFSLNGSYQFSDFRPKIELDDLRKLGWSNNFYTYTPDFPRMSVSGGFDASIEQIFITRDYNTFAFSDDFTWIRGRHTVQLGFDGIRTVQVDQNLSRTNGSYTFNGSLSGLGLADFLLGRPSSFRQGSPAPDNVRGLHLSWYAQDDIRVNRRLTLNLGLRYELPLPPLAINNAAMVYRPGTQSEVYVNAHPGMQFWGDEGVPRAGRTAYKKYFAPRFGLAWSVTSDQKTVLRAGYGMYINPSWSNIEGQFAIYQPFTRIIDIVTPQSTGDPWAGFPGGNPHPYTPDRNAPFDPGIVSLTYGPNFREPVMQQWNLNVQREVASNWLVTVGYVGSRGTHIPYLRDFNAPRLTPNATVANANDRRPLAPNFARFSSFESVASSTYNSFQASLDKRMRGGVSVLMSYTFSKSLHDMNSVLTNNGGGQDPDNRRLEWGPSDFDRTHAFIASWIWQMPGSGLRGLPAVFLKGWEANGIWSMYSGSPLQLSASVDRALRSHPNRPDRIRDARLSGDRSRADTIVQYFDRSAYVPNQPGEFGSAPRADGQLKGPGDFSMTLGIQKNFRGVREQDRFQLRSEFFNLLNRPNFGGPGTNIDSLGNYGRITSASDGRIIQFGLKYIF
ncbi:MAG: carboxypeptidase regulatory-like domain-containing protein [Bryobacteraceae bacterium]